MPEIRTSDEGNGIEVARLPGHPVNPANEAAPAKGNVLVPGQAQDPASGDALARLGQRIARRFHHEAPAPCLSAAQLQEFRQGAQQAKEGDPNISEELSLALGLAQRIRSRRCDIDSAYDRLHFIFQCLTAEPPKLLLATDERLRLQVETYRQAGLISRLLARISAGSPAGLVLAAVGMSMLLWSVLVFGIHYLAHRRPPTPDNQVDTLFSELFFMNGKALAVITSAAFVGGVVSIATRLGEFTRKRDLDPFAMFWTAMLKPLIGVVLSLFLLATLAGGIISFGFLGEDPFNLRDGLFKAPIAPKVLYTLWALGFLSGFSERFAWDFVDRAEGAANGGAGSKKPG